MSDKQPSRASSAQSEDQLSEFNSISSGEIIIGTLTAISNRGQALVDFDKNPDQSPLEALSLVEVHPKNIGRQIALGFNGGNLRNPIIMGYIQSPLMNILDEIVLQNDMASEEPADGSEALDKKVHTENEEEQKPADLLAQVDGERVVIEGEKEIVLRCGESSITLTKAGKILIRGKYLLNRSTGVNRIMGGSVQVN